MSEGWGHEHDAFCYITLFHKPVPCSCDILNMARVDERERIARALEAEAELYKGLGAAVVLRQVGARIAREEP